MTLPTATLLAARIANQEVTAEATIAAALARIAAHNQTLNCFTTILADDAIAAAQKIDAAISNGVDPGPLSGVPFAVKDLLDIKGVTTLAGSKINQDLPPATADATAVERLKLAGAVLVGALNMDEYAYGFVTENSHYGATRNPHDLTRVAGGSSGGSAAAVAAELVPLTLGSDTNGSIRVPASFCGILGLKPTYGRVSRAGAFLFSNSLDHIGPFARSVADIATAFDVLEGPDPRDPICTKRIPDLTLDTIDHGLDSLKIAIADGYFTQKMEADVARGFEQVIKALNVTRHVTIPEAHRARAAAYIITASEGSNFHWDNLRSRPYDFDPATRDRFIAGAFMPATWYLQAQRFRRWYRNQMRQIFQSIDIILTPTTPCVAPHIGQQTMTLDGEEMLVRPNLGLYTQPLSFIGLPILSVPVFLPNQPLPVGIQIIGAPYQEAKILRVAAVLEAMGVIRCQEPQINFTDPSRSA